MFTERDRNAILAALAGLFDEPTQRAAKKVVRTALTNPRTKALELVARLNGELDAHCARGDHRTRGPARP
jgi:hypothetical protein